jgi:hypothetical protein
MATLALSVLLAACGDTGLGPQEGAVRIALSAGTPSPITQPDLRRDGVPRSAGDGTVVSLHGEDGDAVVHPIFDWVDVTIAGVSARDGDGRVTEVDMSLPVTVDVISVLGEREVFLPDGVLPGDAYEQLVVVMTAAEGRTHEGADVTMEPPSGGWSATIPVCPFTVDNGETTRITLRFVIDGAFPADDDGFDFSPSFVCEDVD